MTDEHHDIVIVGGGLIGASLACALAPTTLSVAVVEAVPPRSDAQPSYDEKMLALAPASQRILAGIGVWPAVRSHGVTPLEHIHVSNRGHFGKTRLSAAELGVEALGYVTPARVIGLSLMQRLEDTQSVALHCPARVTAIDTDPEGATVHLEANGGARRVRARLVILADGGTSATRGMLGFRTTTRDYGQTAVLCTVTPEARRPNTAFERFTDSGPLAVLPTTGRRCAVVWTAASADAPAIAGCPDDEFLARLQERFGDWLGRLTAPGERRSFPLKLIRVVDPVRRRALVIGNAAHTIHPVAGQGFNLGLRDVAVLAEVLASTASQGEDVGRMGVLDEYQAWRRRDTRHTTWFTDGLIRVFANEYPPLVAGRNLALTALNHCPPAKRFLITRTMGLSGRLPRLGRGLGLTP